MHAEGPGAAARKDYLPQMIVATLAVAVLPGFVAGGLQGAGLIRWWWLSVGMAIAFSMATAAVGSAVWARRPDARDIVFGDLMFWGWLRRRRAERRLACTRWLLGNAADLDPARQAALLERLSTALETRDPYVHGHSKRVTLHAYMIALQLGLPSEEVARIRTAAALHDVGKIETPREILNKPGRLTDEEFATIKLHASRGAEMIAPLGDEELTAIVRHHHERLDGGGYPDGLRADEIPLGARVIAVADTFDAVTSERPYRSASSHKKALDILRQEAGTQLDPDAVSAFLAYYAGTRSLPWWTAVALAPSRLAVWVVSGVQGAAAAPLGGATAALGATFLVSGALGGATVAGDAGQRVDAASVPAINASSLSTSPGTLAPKQAAGAPSRHPSGANDQSGAGRRGSIRSPQAPTGDRVSSGPPSIPGGGAGANGGGGGRGSSAGGSSSGGGGRLGGGRLPDLPRVPGLPDVKVPAIPQLPRIEPPVTLPGQSQQLPLPQLR